MAYLVSQLRKSEGQKYMQDVQVTPSTITSPNTFGDASKTFTDFALAGTFEPTEVYYLRFQVHKIPKYFYSGSRTVSEVGSYINDADSLNLQILLKNGSELGDEEKNPPEVIGNCTVYTALETELEAYASYSFVFSPSQTFNRLGFRINRVSYDAISSTPRNWLIEQQKIRNTDTKTVDPETGKTIISGIRYTGDYDASGNPAQKTVSTQGDRIVYSGENADLCTLVNLVDQSSGWLKMGYQCRPGSLIVVNGEPIRVGRSGIYEINNGTIINKFMIASPGGSNNSKIDAFLLDYAYKS